MGEERVPNSRQKLAIEYQGGPLAVLAGPGTGKTFVITHRIAHLIHNAGLDPESILAVTFTIKAAGELRDRLTGLVGESVAQRVQAHTFNGYGARLISRFADVLELPPRLTLIDRVQSTRLIREIVLSNGLFPQSRAEGLRTLVQRLARVMECFANLGALPDDALRAARDWRARLQGVDPASAPHLLAEHAACERFEQEATVYSLYAAAKRPKGLVAYADQVTLPIELLRRHAGPAAAVRSELRAVIVDEFQDCNPGQIELLRLLVGPQVRTTPAPLCVVGDDDQAIYGFRGSDDRSFQRFEAIWPGAQVVPLTANYRSCPEVIRVANSTIARAGSRFRPDKTIELPPLRGSQAGVVEAIRLARDSDDAEVIAAWLLAKGPGARRSCAVIARTHGDLDRIGAALTLYDIPFSRARDGSLSRDEGVEDIRAWIEWLVDSNALWPALRVLSRPPFSLPPEFVAGLDREYRVARGARDAGIADSDELPAYPEWLAAKSAEGGPHAPALAHAMERLKTLRSAVKGVSAEEAVMRIITTTDVAHSELLGARDTARRVSALVAFLGLAREKQPRLSQPAELRQLWEYLKELDDAEGDLAPESAEEPDAPQEDEQDRVQLMTAHAAKGLEFDTVFVPRVSPQHGYPKTRTSEEPWIPPRELFDPLDTRDQKSRVLDEERRLFYVACTRARGTLVLLAKHNAKPSSTTHFFEELAPHKGEAIVTAIVGASSVLAAAASAEAGSPAWQAPGAGTIDPTQLAALAQAREREREWAERFRRSARMRAAAALESAQQPDISAQRLAQVERELRESARMIAAVSQAERRGAVPDWIGAGEAAHAAASRLISLRDSDADPDSANAWALLTRPMKGPLKLSYSFIRQYLDCPRCFYLRRVMELEEPQSAAANLGSIVHRSLELFYRSWSRADSEGHPLPAWNDLLASSRVAISAESALDAVLDPGMISQVEAQLKLLWERLHDPNAHVLELERMFRFSYELDNQRHAFDAKLDRVDLGESGEYRVIDYKTGHASKKLTEPSPSDLQMGIYLMAMQHAYGPDIRGQAEYWVLSQGVRGRIDFQDIKLDKVRAEIDRAVRGMLTGEFSPARDCTGPCRLFDV